MLQLHHIGGRKIKNASDIDNAVPLCLTCHAEVHLITNMGNAISPNELKAIRNQVYKEHTVHLVPTIDYRPFQKKIELPEVGFRLQHVLGSWPAKVFLTVFFAIDGKSHEVAKDYYNGRRPWHLNTHTIHTGHFPVPPIAWEHYQQNAEVTAVFQVQIQDSLEYRHELLDVAWTLTRRPDRSVPPDNWFFEPSPPQT